MLLHSWLINLVNRLRQSAFAPARRFPRRRQRLYGERFSNHAEVFEVRLLLAAEPIGTEFLVNTFTVGNQQFSTQASPTSVASAPDGSFVVAWCGPGAGDKDGVFVRRLDNNLSPLAPQFLVNQTISSKQISPSVASLAGGGFAVAWSGRGVGDKDGIFVRTFDAGGLPQTGELLVNQTTSKKQEFPAVAGQNSGGFTVGWSGNGTGDKTGVFVREFDAVGQPLTGEQLANTTVAGAQKLPSLASVGSFVVVWHGNGRGDSSGVFAQMFGGLDTNPPVVTAELANDTGVSDRDRLTSDPTIRGIVTNASGVASFCARFDSTPISICSSVLPDLQADGQFTLSRTRLEQIFGNPLPEGPHTLYLQARDARGIESPVFDVPLTLDTTPPAAPALDLIAASDSGASDTDDITNNATPTVAADSEPESLVALYVDSVFGGSAAATNATHFELGPLLDGSYALTATATDPAGNVSELSRSLLLIVDTQAQADPQFDLSAASDSGAIGDHLTRFARVTLVGQTEGNARVLLEPISETALARNTGVFELPQIALSDGDNMFVAHTVDLAGNRSPGFAATIHRETAEGQEDPVLRWNQALLEAIRLDATAPPLAARAMAIVHAAILDAVNPIEGRAGHYVSFLAPAGASVDAAVAGAADRVLTYLYPAQQPLFDTVLAASLDLVPDGQAEQDGLALGQLVGDAMLSLRAHDGWVDFVDYVPRAGAGFWQATPPMFDLALLPQWATLEPFAMSSPDQFRPAGPPALTSTEYAAALSDVKSLGRIDSLARTADQTQIARFWADGTGTYTPPGHWNRIAAEFARQQNNSPSENARLFAELNVALADAAVVAWDAKYFHEFWRPITAIRQADSDGNAATDPDAAWAPLLITPPFPEYVSGHSTFSGAAEAVLAANFGDGVGFTATSASLPGVERTFSSFHAAAEEAGRSRIYGGIHFEFANQDGLHAGRALARHVLDTFSVSADALPPQVFLVTPLPGVVTADNLLVQGRVIDNLSGVATLEVRLDDGEFAGLPFDPIGNFTLPTALPLDGSADGLHVLRFRADPGTHTHGRSDPTGSQHEQPAACFRPQAPD